MGWTDWAKQRLTEVGRSGADLGRALGKPESARTVGSDVVNGKRPVRLSEVETVAEFFEVSPSALLREMGYDFCTAGLVDPELAGKAAGAVLAALMENDRVESPELIEVATTTTLREWILELEHDPSASLRVVADTVVRIHFSMLPDQGPSQGV